MSRILIWTPNYAPELTGIPPLVTDAAEWLAGAGHEVHVVTALPNYPERRIYDGYRRTLWRHERLRGVEVHRSWLRARQEKGFVDKVLYELTVSTFALPNAVRIVPNADVVICVIPTLLAAAYAALLTRVFRKRLVLWVQDLVPAAARAVVSGDSQALAVAEHLERQVVSAATQIVVCSPGFRDHFIRHGIDPERIDTVLNWADTSVIQRIPPTRGRPARFLYSGNIGYTQGLDTLVSAARLAGDEVVVEIRGAGNAANAVASAAAAIPNVVCAGPVLPNNYPALLASADAHLVLQRRVSAGANFPSKIATALASGRPVVAAIPPETPAAALLRESGAVVLVEPESPAALAQAMRELAQDPIRREELGRSARLYAERHLSKEAALARLTAAFLGPAGGK